MADIKWEEWALRLVVAITAGIIVFYVTQKIIGPGTGSAVSTGATG